MTMMASKMQWQCPVLPGMLPTTIVTRLEATDEEFCKLPPRCFLGVLLASSLFAASPEDDVAAFVIDNATLLACTRICWGGLELWRPRLQTLHLLTAYFGHQSEVEPKTIFMGHEILSCHAPVVSSFFILFKTLVSSRSICYVHLVKLELITLYCPKVSPKFVKLASGTVPISTSTVQKLSCTVPISTCTCLQFNLIC